MEPRENVKKSVSSVVALVVSIIALLLSPVPIINNFSFFLAIVAFIFGFIGLTKSRKNHLRGRKTAIIALMLALLACIVAFASQKFYVDSLNKVGKDVQTSVDKATGKKTSDILGKELDVAIGQFTATPGQYTTDTVLPIKVTNKNSQAKSYSIQIEAVDAVGTRITDDTITVNNLGPNQSQDFRAFQYVQSDKVEALKTAKFKVATVSQY